MPHRLTHAKAYPFAAHHQSYVLLPGGHTPLEADHWDLLDGLMPVIASGSNRAPSRLLTKYQGLDHAPIPVTRARVKDIDSVYSAHFSTYGSIPATLHLSPGTTAHLAVTWLGQAELDHMHATESLGVNYDFKPMDDITITLENGRMVEGAHAYVSRRGAFAPDGAPIALAATQADGRRFAAMYQVDIMTRAYAHIKEQAYAHLTIAETLDAFLLSIIEDDDHRFSMSDLLETAVLPFAEA